MTNTLSRFLAAAPSLTEITSFGDNPGNLRMLTHIPRGLAAHAPLVVVLHGCGQTAAAMAHGSGWVELADRHGFALLAPEQRQANNANTCFNWFCTPDNRHGLGEAASIAAMIGHTIAAQEIDVARVFITGLSAGGAFANVMLATYPELFAAGAIVGGMPFAAADTVHAALDLMRGGGQMRTDRQWGDLLRAAAPPSIAWPRIAVWQGLADRVVAPANATAIVRQWLDVRGIPDSAMRLSRLGQADRQIWADANGAPAIELVTVPGLRHGVPISSRDPDDDLRCGRPGPYILETGLSSTALIARDWGLTRRLRPDIPSRLETTIANAGVTLGKSPVRRAPIDTLATTLRKFILLPFTKP